MKKFFSIVAIAAFSMLLVLGNSAQAQTRQQKRDAKKGLATLCVGGGMGAAAIGERE